MIRPLIYKLSTDDNGAPCVTDELLTLAICKPGYRHVAEKGNFLFGFMGKSSAGNHTQPLVYIAEITEEPISAHEYYTNKEYIGRPDRIYKYVDGQFEIRANALYHNYKKRDKKNKLHSDRRDADLGAKRDAKVLLSRNFRYLGDKRIIVPPNIYPELSNFVDRLGQTRYPPNGVVSSAIFNQAMDLMKDVWDTNSTMKIGKAIHEPSLHGDCGKGSWIISVKKH